MKSKCINKNEVNSVMLLQFRFSNFRSFADESVFDMTAAPIPEHNKYSLINRNGVDILPVAAIYGANASGKSSFFMAFDKMRTLVIDRFIKNDHRNNDMSFSEPFFFDECHNPTNYEVTLLIGINKYRYGFECIDNTINGEYLYKQRLSRNQTIENLIFERSNQNGNKRINCGKVNATILKEIKYCYSMLTEKNLLLTDIGLRDKEKEMCSIFQWFLNADVFLSSSQEALSYSNIGEQIFGDFLTRENNDKILKQWKLFVSDFDTSISDIIPSEKTASNGKQYTIAKVRHLVNNKKYDTPLTMESDGTNKAMFIALTVIQSLEYGSPIFFDELDSKLHPLLLRRIIQMFTNKETNPNGAQLIFSAHNIINLDSSDLRRDEVWFVEKQNYKSSIYSLVDFDSDEDAVQKDSDFGKHYLSGRFGAVPFQE